MGQLKSMSGPADISHLFNETVAAWVQAIGSIVAIIAGFAAGRYQAKAAHAENMSLAAQADRNAKEAAASLASMAVGEVEAVLAWLQSDVAIDGSDIQRRKRAVEYQRETIASFPIASLKDGPLMERLAPLPSILDSVADNLRELADTTLQGSRASPVVRTLIIGRIARLQERAVEELHAFRRLVQAAL